MWILIYIKLNFYNHVFQIFYHKENNYLQGFARYSTDSKWHVPHFEKMLYDQAQLAVVYSNAYLLTKDEKFANVVRDILTYVSRDLSHSVRDEIYFAHLLTTPYLVSNELITFDFLLGRWFF